MIEIRSSWFIVDGIRSSWTVIDGQVWRDGERPRLARGPRPLDSARAEIRRRIAERFKR